MGSEITLLVMLLSLQSSTTGKPESIVLVHYTIRYIIPLTDGVQIPVQVVPRGIESVNGSSVNMGCTEELTITDGFTTCGSPGNGAIIYLIDGSSPNYIDTSAPDWASRLVVVRRNESYPSDSIVLSFGFDTDVSPSAVEIDLFLCSEWTFWVTKISLYANEQFDLAFTGILHLGSFLYPLESFCGSLSTITLTSWLPSSYQTFHIVMNFAYDPFIEYVNIGEVRFNGINFEGRP